MYASAGVRDSLNVNGGSGGSPAASARFRSTEWMSKGRCGGASEYYFAPFAERPEARVRREARARAICEKCSVIVECRDYARSNRELGFWGGESESERAEAGFPPTTPIIGRKQVAERRARKAMRRAI